MTETPDDDVDTGRPRGLPPIGGPPVEPPSAWRLTFEYDDTGVRLVARQQVSMLAPPDDSDLTFAARAGYWVELRDEDGHGLYRQILVDPMQSHYEVHSPREGARPIRVPALTGDTGVFQAVVPDLPQAEDVVLHGLAEPGPAETLVERTQESAVEILAARLRVDPGEEGA